MKKSNLSQKVSETLGKVSQKITHPKATPHTNSNAETTDEYRKDVGNNIVDRKD